MNDGHGNYEAPNQGELNVMKNWEKNEPEINYNDMESNKILTIYPLSIMGKGKWFTVSKDEQEIIIWPVIAWALVRSCFTDKRIKSVDNLIRPIIFVWDGELDVDCNSEYCHEKDLDAFKKKVLER